VIAYLHQGAPVVEPPSAGGSTPTHHGAPGAPAVSLFSFPGSGFGTRRFPGAGDDPAPLRHAPPARDAAPRAVFSTNTTLRTNVFLLAFGHGGPTDGSRGKVTALGEVICRDS